MKLIYALAGALALTACGPAKEPAKAQPKPKPPAVKVAPKFIGPPIDPKQAAAPLTAEGWGKVKMDMRGGEARLYLGRVEPAPEKRDQDWFACHFMTAVKPEGVKLMLEEDFVTAVLVDRANGVLTDREVGVGDPVAKVRRAYPTGLTEQAGSNGLDLVYWFADEPKGGLRYRIGPDGKVTSILAGQRIGAGEGCS